MQDTRPPGIYRVTSIARPVDPAYPTNRTLLVLLPLLALVSAGLASATDQPPLAAAINALLTGFVAWALTRELAPDDEAAAFVALGLAFAAHLGTGTNGVLLPFLALVLVRIVNRSTGLPARVADTVAVLGFALWAGQEQPLLLPVAAIAFALDAVLEGPLRRHYLAAGVSLAAFVWLLFGGRVDAVMPDVVAATGLGAFLLLTLLLAWRQAEPVSRGDIGAELLDRTRVRAGLILGYLLAAQAVVADGSAAWLATPVWLCIAAVALSRIGRGIASA